MKQVTCTVLLLAAFFHQSFAQVETIFPQGHLSGNEHNTGSVWLNELNKADSVFNFSIAEAAFAPNAKLDWHIHPAGQILLITNGIGYYQEKGKPVQTVRKGDIIKCGAVEHWHGASPQNNFAYVAISPSHKGKTQWLQKVTNEEYASATPPASDNKNVEQEILNLSKKKWHWMADKNADSLSTLFDEKSVFVHMGGSWGKEQEVNIIKSGGIHYKKADVHSSSVKIIGNTAILLNDITLLAVVGPNEVSNPFIVTEVYVKESGKWMLGSLSFTKKLVPEDRKN